MIDPGAVRLSDVIADAKKRRDLGDRHLAAKPYTHTDNPTLRFGEAEIDAARAAGCLVEHQVDHGEWTSTVAFITDVEFAADLAERLVERIVKEEAERKKREEEWRAQSQGREPLTPEQKKEERKAAYKERQEKAETARIWNGTVGANLLKRRGSASRKQFALARVKAMAIALITDNPTLAARGLRLVTSQLQEVEVKQLKTTGKTKEKVSYADAEQSTAYLVKRVDGRQLGQRGRGDRRRRDGRFAAGRRERAAPVKAGAWRPPRFRRGGKAALRRHQIGAAAAPAPQGEQLAASGEGSAGWALPQVGSPVGLWIGPGPDA